MAEKRSERKKPAAKVSVSKKTLKELKPKSGNAASVKAAGYGSGAFKFR